MKSWKVCVRCYTFNHAPYILDALKGFVSQQTEFPYVCCIVDDASKDGEQGVIKKYVSENFIIDNENEGYIKETDYGTLMFARHKLNSNCYFAAVLLKENHNGSPELKAKKRGYIAEWEKNCKYEALCEGDDYWTDPLKLQKQVDFLDSHPDYGMCYTNFNLLYQSTGKVIRDVFTNLPHKYKAVYGSNEEFLLRKGYVCPASWVIRMDCYNIPKVQTVDGTFVQFVHFLSTSKVKYLDDTTATYRVLSESASHSTNVKVRLNRAKNLYETQLKLINLYKMNKQLEERCREDYYKSILVDTVTYNFKEDTRLARQFIKHKDLRSIILLMLDSLHVGYLLRLIRK